MIGVLVELVVMFCWILTGKTVFLGIAFGMALGTLISN